MMDKPKLIVILGPTAAGKTALAIHLAQKFNGEIVSADSRQIYRGLDIGTAKPGSRNSEKTCSALRAGRGTLSQRPSKFSLPGKPQYKVQGIPHYLIDIVKPNQKFSVALYQKMALAVIEDIFKRGKTPFLVGGTGLFLQAVVDNPGYAGVKPDFKLRKKLEQKTLSELQRTYQKLDPRGAKLIDQNNPRRLIRAIEVCRSTGQPFWPQRTKKELPFETLQLGVNLPPRQLEKIMAVRVRKMLDSGLEREARQLFRKHGALPALQSIGYQEWRPYLNRKTSPAERREVEENIILHTRQYAKRQMTWFKKDKRIIWIKTALQAKKLVKDFLKKKNVL